MTDARPDTHATAAVETRPAAMPPVPLTLEGSPTLHQMFRFRWSQWKHLQGDLRTPILDDFKGLLRHWDEQAAGKTGLFSMLGHKGDLMFMHFRDSFEELNQVEHDLSLSEFSDFLEPTTSYVSVVELGLYESTAKTYKGLMDQGITPFGPEWNAGLGEVMERQRTAMKPRLYPDIPDRKYACFYPMDRKRGEDKNWYSLPLAERQRMMHEHGMIGRRYADEVKQIITGSIGFDDYEWGVTLFAEDPLVFKKLIYEMRFDEVSAEYALFGSFYVGIRMDEAAIEAMFLGEE